MILRSLTREIEETFRERFQVLSIFWRNNYSDREPVFALCVELSGY